MNHSPEELLRAFAKRDALIIEGIDSVLKNTDFKLDINCVRVELAVSKLLDYMLSILETNEELSKERLQLQKLLDIMCESEVNKGE